MNVGGGLSYQLLYSNIHHENLTVNKIIHDYPNHPFEGAVNSVILPAPKKTINNVMTLTIDLTFDYKITNSISILLDYKFSYGASYTDETNKKTNDYHYVYLTGFYRSSKGKININYIPAIGMRYFIY